MEEKKIVIVEDEMIIAEDIKSTLELHGYNVLKTFSKGEDAVKEIPSLSPNLILMDIMLAGEMNGIQTAEKIHAISNIPVIYLTAYANDDILKKAKITEPFGYLIKPFEERELYATIEMAFYRYQLEERIYKNELRFSTIFQNAPNIIFYEYGRKENFVSDNLKTILGLDADDFIKTKDSYLNFINPEEEAFIRDKIKKWEDQNCPDMLTLWYRIKNSSGRYLWVEDRRVKILHGNEDFISGVIIDNTDLKQAESDLKKSHARYKAIVEDQTEFICRFDREKKISFINQAYCRFSKKEMLDLIGTNWLGEVPEKCRNEIDELLLNLSCENSVATYEFWIQTEPDKKIFTEWTFRAIYNNKHEFIEFQAVGKDTTLRKIAEMEKEKIREQLYQSQKMEVVGNLAGGIAHDFNNLLTAINGYADIAMKKLDDKDPVYKDLTVIKDCGLKAASLTQQLLGFSRKQIIEKKVIDINEIIRNLNKMLLRLIGENVSLKLDVSEKPAYILADAGQIEQVLINLIVNARDALPDGGKIIVSSQKKLIDEKTAEKLTLSASGIYQIISVKDDGTGIEPKILDKIFEPFFTTKEVGKGTGLGLATAYGITKQNNGHIKVKSELGKGTEFTVYVPAIEAEEKPEEVENEIANIEGGSETILLVEDEEAIRDFVSSILEEYGYKVLEAVDGENGLEVANQYPQKIHLLLTDIRMPKMTGPELAEQVKLKHQDMKVLFVSGHTGNDNLRKKIEESQAGFLQKPFSFEALIEKVRTILDSK